MGSSLRLPLYDTQCIRIFSNKKEQQTVDTCIYSDIYISLDFTMSRIDDRSAPLYRRLHSPYLIQRICWSYFLPTSANGFPIRGRAHATGPISLPLSLLTLILTIWRESGRFPSAIWGDGLWQNEQHNIQYSWLMQSYPRPYRSSNGSVFAFQRLPVPSCVNNPQFPSQPSIRC